MSARAAARIRFYWSIECREVFVDKHANRPKKIGKNLWPTGKNATYQSF